MITLLRQYGVGGSIRLISDLIKTKLFFKRARIVRSPYYIRGKGYIDFGANLTTGVGIRLDAFGNRSAKDTLIKFGNNIQINDYVHIGATDSVILEDNVLIASKVFISDHNHGNYSGDAHSSPLTIPSERKEYSAPVLIQRNTWIGESVSILPGVTIGEGCIIGANSCVTKSIPSFSIAVGTPAKVIKVFNFESKKWEQVEK